MPQDDNPLNDPALQNPAIARCSAAGNHAYLQTKRKKNGQYLAAAAARKAFSKALPPLDSPENLRDFIACVTYGMSIQAIDGEDGAGLLSAARVARAVYRPTPSRNAKPQLKPAPQPAPED
jgi:hypothetical protein